MTKYQFVAELQDEDGTMIAKVSSHTLNGLQEELHKLESKLEQLDAEAMDREDEGRDNDEKAEEIEQLIN